MLASAALLLGVALVNPRLPRLGGREWATLVLLGLVGNSAFQLCMVGGLRYTTPAHSALMISLHPVFAVLLAWLWLGEPLRARRAIGILLALAGAGLIVVRGDASTADSSIVGDLLSLGAAAAWAGYSVVGKPLLATSPPLELTTLAMTVGALALLPLGLPGLTSLPWATFALGTWLLLGYISVLSLGVAYGLWYWALARAATGRVVVFSYLTPVVAAAISVATGQEVLTGTLVMGAGAVLAGIALAHAG